MLNFSRVMAKSEPLWFWQKLKIHGLQFFMNWRIGDYLHALDEIIIQRLRNSPHSKLLILILFRFKNLEPYQKSKTYEYNS